MRTLTILLVTLVVLTALSAAQLRQQSPLQPGRPVPGTEIPVEGVGHWVCNPENATFCFSTLTVEPSFLPILASMGISSSSASGAAISRLRAITQLLPAREWFGL